MLICSPALNRVLIQFGSRDKIASLGRDVLDILLERALPMGCLRLHSQRSNLNLKFQGIDFARWITRAAFKPNVNALITLVKRNSNRRDLSSQLLLDAIGELEEAGYDPREICCGTDLIEILSIGLRGQLGSSRTSRVNSETLRTSLSLAYEEQEFRTSHLGMAIQTWEDQQTGFRVLPTEEPPGSF